FPPTPPPVVGGPQGWGPQPPPHRRKGRGPVVAGVVVAAVIGLALANSLLPDGSDEGGSRQPTAGNSAAASGGKRPDPQPAEYKGIDLTENFFVMLADNPPRPTGKEGATVGSKGDLYYQPRVLNVVDREEITTRNGKLVLLAGGQQGSLDTCRSETRYAKSVRLDQLGDGSQLCVLSDAGHIAVATYRGRSSAKDPSTYITLDLTVWRNAEEPQKKG
ncbi:serine/threonine protein kinase, partial [Streptomyces sp. MB09-01]|nr:serine/threonine protein kinase [Streptomyces sp. MB09-01]